MKKQLLHSGLILFLLSAIAMPGFAQYDGPVEYMEDISGQYKKIMRDTWRYTKAVTRNKRDKKIHRKRENLLETIKEAKLEISKLPPYQGDKSLKDSVTKYLDLNYNVINKDYAEIVDMEEVAEQSYDMMEAYLLAQEKAGDKLDRASKIANNQYRAFAEKHNVTLTEEDSRLGEKLEQANEVAEYYNDIYLVFFKSYKQEAYVLDAIEKGDVNAIEQNKDALKKTASEGQEDLKEFSAFKGSNSLILSCNKLLKFYEKEAEKDLASISDFYLKKEVFEKVKTAFESKKKSKRTQKDVDQYNKAVNEYNAASKEFNEVNARLSQRRGILLEEWNNNVESFFNTFSP